MIKAFCSCALDKIMFVFYFSQPVAVKNKHACWEQIFQNWDKFLIVFLFQILQWRYNIESL